MHDKFLLLMVWGCFSFLDLVVFSFIEWLEDLKEDKQRTSNRLKEKRYYNQYSHAYSPEILCLIRLYRL